MNVLGTEMHLVTFLITLFESVLFFIQLIYFLSRPNDQARMRYLFLLFLLIYYNIVSGLLPDATINLNITIQNLLAYSSGIIVSMYFVYYIYKTFDFTGLKIYASYYSYIALAGSFIFAFALPYIFFGDLDFSRRLIVLAPIVFAIAFITALTKALLIRYKQQTDHIARQEIIGVYASVVLWGTLPLIVYFNGSQLIENLTTNTGFMIMSVLFIRTSIYRSRADYEKLEKSEEVLREINQTLQAQVEERTQELRIANEERMNAFINLVHEAKTPLTLINNYLDKVTERVGTNEDLRLTKANMDKLTRDINNFFDIYRANRGEQLYDHSGVTNFSEVLMIILPLFENYSQQQGLIFQHKIVQEIHVKADPHSLYCIATNLIMNAIKFTEKHGTVKVELRSDDHEILFQVRDTGCGISEEFQQKIFEPYYQVSHRKSNYQGLGLGLNMVKVAVDSLGGTIQLESSVGFGSNFTIKLKRTHEKVTQIPKVNGYSFDGISDQVVSDHFGDADNQLILVLEDNTGLLKLIVDELKDDYNVLAASNGKVALEKLKEVKIPDLIISDVMMDEMDGIEFLRQIKSMKKYQLVPLIFLSAKSDIEAKLNGYSLGAIDYIPKPVGMKELRMKVNAHIVSKEKHIFSYTQEVLRNAKVNPSDMKPSFDDICKRFNISLQEMKVIYEIIHGKSNDEIANKLNISAKTVSRHNSNIFTKLRVKSRHEVMGLFNAAE